MVSIPHPDTRVVPNVYLRRGFNENDPTPAAMRASPNLRRTALILSPFRAGAKPANLRWPDCAPLYWRLVSDVSELVPDSVLTIVDGTRRFSSRDEWLAEERKTLADPDDDPEAPARCVWNGPDGAPLVDARTEYWHCAGGPAPYSDSWTISFYSATPALDEAVRDAILRRCAEAGLPIVDDKPEGDHPVPLRRRPRPHPYGIYALAVVFAIAALFFLFVLPAGTRASDKYLIFLLFGAVSVLHAVWAIRIERSIPPAGAPYGESDDPIPPSATEPLPHAEADPHAQKSRSTGTR